MLEYAKEHDAGSYRVLSYENFFQLPSPDRQALYDDVVVLKRV